MDKNMKIEFSSALLDIAEVNSSFDIGKLRVAYTGKNRNNTFISKESFERAIPTMFNCPVVAHYIREEEQIGSHDGEFVKDKDGNVKYVNVTQPVGLVPESAHWSWEEVDDNGVIHQYLCTEVVLWKRQEAYEAIKTNGITKQSMEIQVDDGEMLDDYYNIKDFTFTAFCLLGTAEPCFESAALFTFADREEFKAQYTEMLKEFKLAFASADNNKKEGNEDLKLNELLEKYSVALEDIDFEVEGLSDEELEAKFADVFESIESESVNTEESTESAAEDAEIAEGSDKDEDIDDIEVAEDESDDGSEGEDFALESQIHESLRQVVTQEKITDDWGEYSRRWMIDYDAEAQEVYYYDNDDGNLYGCTYTLDGDDVVIDFAAQKRKKFAIVDYVEGENTPDAVYELVKTYRDKYIQSSAIDPAEFERLQEFERTTLASERAEAEEALFAKFEAKLGEDEEFKTLRDKASEFELDALEKELYALVGKVDFNFSLKNMGKNEEKNNKPLIGFEAAFAATKTSDEAAMDNFMDRYLKK